MTYNVFISSTFLDNQERRRVITDAIERAGMRAIGMERFTADVRPAVEYCTRLAADADVLIGLLAWRYGWVPPEYDISICELEYNAAPARLMFILDNKSKPDPDLDFDKEDKWLNQHRLDQFKLRVAHDGTPGYVSDSSLGVAVLQALNNWKQSQEAGMAAHHHRPSAIPSDKRKLAAVSSSNIAARDIEKAVRHPNASISSSHHQEALERHLEFARGWSAYIGVHGHKKDHRTTYIPLPVYEGEVRRQENPKKTVPLTHVLSGPQSCIILGGPGAGKTTSLQQLAHLAINSDPSAKEFPYPVVLRIRDLDSGQTVTERILSLLGISVSIKNLDHHSPEYNRLLRETQTLALVHFLKKTSPLILVDGLDEAQVSDTLPICTEIDTLIAATGSKFVISCRHGAYTTRLHNCQEYSVMRFSEDQLRSFSAKWLGSDERSQAFHECLSKKPYRELALVPLHATNFCLIFDTYGDLPRENIRVYERVIDIRVREWDRERGLVRKSPYRDFGPDEKRRLLSNVTFELAKIDTSPSFSVQRFSTAYEKVKSKFGLSNAPYREILAELESHTGLIYLSNYEQYDFIHKTMQEFLLGKHLASIPILSEYQDFLKNSPDACALGTILSEDPDAFLVCLWRAILGPMEYRLRWTEPITFWIQYFQRLVSEKAFFSGNKIAGLGVCAIASDCASWQFEGSDSNLAWRRAVKASSLLNDQKVYSDKDPREASAMIIRGEISHTHDMGKSFVEATTSAVLSSGLSLGIHALLQRSTPKDEEKALWGCHWRRFHFSKRKGVSDSLGQFSYPEELWIPTHWIAPPAAMPVA